MQNFFPVALCHPKFGCHFQEEYLLHTGFCSQAFVLSIYLFLVGSTHCAVPIDYSALSQFDAYRNSDGEFITVYCQWPFVILWSNSVFRIGKNIGISETQIFVIYYLSQKFHPALLPVNSLAILIPVFCSWKARYYL